MAGQLSNAHGTIVIDGDFSAFDANARKAVDNAKFWGDKFDSVSGTVKKQLAAVANGTEVVTRGTKKMADAQDELGAATKKTTRLTFEQRKELEMLRRETKLLAEAERVASSGKIQDKIKERSTLIQEEQRITNAQLQEMRKRQQAMRALLSTGPSGSMAASPLSMFSPLPGMTAFGSFHSRFQNAQQRAAMVQAGMSPSAALFGQVAMAASSSNQRYLMNNAIANAAPPIFGGGSGTTGGGGPRRPGGMANNFLGPGGLGARMVGGLRGGLGMGLGFFGAMQAGREAVQVSQLATAYERQRIAAERLAGSQANLNTLLDAYQRASGGAVSQAIALENVTRLQATGFAKTAAQVEKFVRGSRGASIALGKPQDYIIQETQLAISNTSVKRLDQIGLGIEEVTNRTEELRDSNKGLTREMAFGQAVLGLLNEKYGTLTTTLEGQATGVEKLEAAWQDLRLAMGKEIRGSVNVVAGGMADALDMSDNPKTANFLQRTAVMIARAILAGKGIDPDAAFSANRQAATLTAMDDRQINAGMMTTSIRSRGAETARFDDEEMSTLIDFHERRQQIEEQYNAERLREVEEYESQRATIIRNFAKQMAREEEDFARSRARSNRDYDKQVSEVHENAAKRDAELLEDYTKRLSDMREDGEEKLSDLQEQYNEDREKAEKEHLDRLMSAAGQLNAVAVLEEKKRYRREQEDRKEAYDKQVEETQENLEEQRQDAKEAYEERLADARDADEERLRDMQESREQQLADEDEDRALRLARAQEDHEDQLAELDRQHSLRLKQIEDEAQKERDLWEKEFEQLLLDMDVYVAGLTEKEAERNKIIEDWFDAMIDKMEKDIENQERWSRRGPDEVPVEVPAGFANGGWVGRTGKAFVHEGEFVLSRSMLAGRSAIPASVAGAMMTNNNQRSITIAEGAISISAVPGDSMEYLSELIEDRMVAILEAA